MEHKSSDPAGAIGHGRAESAPESARAGGATGRRPGVRRTWILSPVAIVAAPLLAVIASCADVVLILVQRGASSEFSVRGAALATVPLSIAAGAWTCFMLLRLRR